MDCRPRIENFNFNFFFQLNYHPKRSNSWAQMLGNGMDVGADHDFGGFMNYKGLRG